MNIHLNYYGQDDFGNEITWHHAEKIIHSHGLCGYGMDIWDWQF